MNAWVWVLVSLSSGAAPFELDPVLVKIGARLEAGRNSSCAMVEVTTVEELDKAKKPIAREIHTAKLVRVKGEVTRGPAEVKKDLGELNSRLRPKNDSELTSEEKDRRKAKLPFHDSEREKFRFRWVGTPKDGVGTIGFSPLTAAAERGTGFAEVNVETGALLSLTSRPSKFPAFLSELDLQLKFAETAACGPELSRIDVTGEGGFLFLRFRFRSVSVFSEHAAVQ